MRTACPSTTNPHWGNTRNKRVSMWIYIELKSALCKQLWCCWPTRVRYFWTAAELLHIYLKKNTTLIIKQELWQPGELMWWLQREEQEREVTDDSVWRGSDAKCFYFVTGLTLNSFNNRFVAPKRRLIGGVYVQRRTGEKKPRSHLNTANNLFHKLNCTVRLIIVSSEMSHQAPEETVALKQITLISKGWK